MDSIVNFITKAMSRYRYSIILLRQLVITDFKLRYKGSVLGYVWSLLKPLALFAVLYVVFIHFLKFGADSPHSAVLLLVGVVLWNYFTEVTSNGLSAIVSKGDLMRKLSFPRYVIVVAGSFSALINLAINLVVVGFFLVLNGVDLSWSIFWIIPLIVELFILGLSIAFLLSALYVKFRDVTYIWELLLQAGFYATPILYPIALVIKASPTAAKLMILNPAAQIMQDVRASIVPVGTPTITSIFGNPYIHLVPIAVVVLLAVVSITYFRKKSAGFAEDI
ncbi:MAG: transporter [Candidatus Saccharibacteria bacterium]|nr:transporter [Candidatus Saccharibacteria bacterium]